VAGKQPQAPYTKGEEIAHSVLHGVGILLSIGGLAVLVAFAALAGSARAIVGVSVFGATLILLYVASTLYHSIPWIPAKRVFRALDHAAIFLLIAGTYTPFTLVSLKGPWGWSLFGVIWGLAILGILFDLTPLGRWRPLRVVIYLAMGWLMVIAFRPLMHHLAPGGLVLLVLGGVAYSAGALFYLWRRMPYNHAVWHAFVLAGSVLHYFAVLFYVVPARP